MKWRRRKKGKSINYFSAVEEKVHSRDCGVSEGERRRRMPPSETRFGKSCGRSGDLTDFISKFEMQSVRFAALWLPRSQMDERRCKYKLTVQEKDRKKQKGFAFQ